MLFCYGITGKMNFILGIIAIALLVVSYLYIRWINTTRDAQYDKEALEFSELDMRDFPHEPNNRVN